MKRNNLTILLMLLVIFNAVGWGIIVFDNPLTTQEIYGQNVEKTVEVKSDFGGSFAYGTGAVISADGCILTNKHMVFASKINKNADHIYIRFVNEEDYCEVELVEVAENEDLALVKVERKGLKCFNLAKNWKEGENIYTFGNPNNFGLSFATGQISSGIRNVIYNGVSRKVMQLSLVVNEGNSGGAIFNSQGLLVGIVSFRILDGDGDVVQGITFAEPLENIKSFLSAV